MRTFCEQLHLTHVLLNEHLQHAVCVRPKKTGVVFRFHS